MSQVNKGTPFNCWALTRTSFSPQRGSVGSLPSCPRGDQRHLPVVCSPPSEPTCLPSHPHPCSPGGVQRDFSKLEIGPLPVMAEDLVHCSTTVQLLTAMVMRTRQELRHHCLLSSPCPAPQLQLPRSPHHPESHHCTQTLVKPPTQDSAPGGQACTWFVWAGAQEVRKRLPMKGPATLFPSAASSPPEGSQNHEGAAGPSPEILQLLAVLQHV